jgi:hypothetical protein
MPIQDFSGDDPNYGQGAGGQIAGLLGQMPDVYQKQAEKKNADFTNQVKLYHDLRESGYSAEEAQTRVQRNYRSTNFLESVIGGTDNKFTKGSETDKVGMEREKAVADLEHIKAQTASEQADVPLKQARTTKEIAGAGRLDRMATNPTIDPQINKNTDQLRKSLELYIKSHFPNILDGTASEDEKMQFAQDRNVARYQGALNKANNVGPMNSDSKASAATAKIKVKRLADGKKGTINEADFDPAKYQKV